MIVRIGLIACVIFLTSCSSYKLVTRKEISEFIKNPHSNRIDPGWSGDRKETRMNGYLRYAITPTSGFTYKDSAMYSDDDYLGEETQSRYYYKGKALEPEFSFGGEVTHCITENFGVGGHFDVAHYYLTQNTSEAFGEYNDNYYGFYQAGFHFRFTKTNGIVTTGYRPEWSFGKFDGYHTIIKEYAQNFGSSVYDTTTITSGNFSRFHFNFCHNVFCRIDPVKPFGIFAGLQHTINPYKAFENHRIVHHSFSFYTGAGLEVADLVSITPWFALPLFKMFTYPDAPCSIGLIAGLIF